MKNLEMLKESTSDYFFGTEIKGLGNELRVLYRQYYQKVLTEKLSPLDIEEGISAVETISRREESFFIDTHKNTFNIIDFGAVALSIIDQDPKWLTGIPVVEAVRAYFAYSSRNLKNKIKKSIEIYTILNKNLDKI